MTLATTTPETKVSAPIAVIATGMVNGLGAHFGVPLLERHGRGVRPTPAARLLESYARQAVGLLRRAERAAADLQGLRSGALTGGATRRPVPTSLARKARAPAARPNAISRGWG